MAPNCRLLFRLYSQTSNKNYYRINLIKHHSSASAPFWLSSNRDRLVTRVGNDKQIQLHHDRTITSNVQQTSAPGGTPRPYIDPKLSYAYGRTNEHLAYSTVAQELCKQIEKNPDHICIICHAENKHVTYRQLGEDVNRVCKALSKRFGVKKGDAVGVFAYNCYHWPVIQFACARLGARLTPINPSNKTRELAFILKKGNVKCLFMPGPLSVQKELNDHLEVLQSQQIVDMSQANELHLQDVIFMDGENELEYQKSNFAEQFKIANCNLHTWSAVQENDGKIFDSSADAEEAGVSEQDACVICPDSVSPDDVFGVYYTSGTTGTPKGACVSHFTVVNNVRLVLKRIHQGRSPNWRLNLCTTLPMFHIFAGVLNTLGIAIDGTSRVIYSGHKYDIATYVDAIKQNNGNFISTTPTILIDLLTYVETNKVTGLPVRIIQAGGASMSPEVISRAHKVLPEIEEVVMGYGSTEQGSLASIQTMHEPAETRPFTVGPPLSCTEVRIVDPKTGVVVPHGERGEIQTRGHNVMLEYLDEPAKTAEVITPSRWYRTGDIGFMHPHGSIQIASRLKHMIIRGGENIYPEEIEQLIHTLEYVEDVHVVGLPDKRYGEQVCAWIKLKPGYREARAGEDTGPMDVRKEDILRFCKDNITYFKVPKYLLFLDEFPLTPTKKVQNHVLIEWGIKQLNLQDQIS